MRPCWQRRVALVAPQEHLCSYELSWQSRQTLRTHLGRHTLPLVPVERRRRQNCVIPTSIHRYGFWRPSAALLSWIRLLGAQSNVLCERMCDPVRPQHMEMRDLFPHSGCATHRWQLLHARTGHSHLLLPVQLTFPAHLKQLALLVGRIRMQRSSSAGQPSGH